MDRFLCQLSFSKGPISRASRESIAKRKAEWAQLSLSDRSTRSRRRRTGDSPYSPHELPSGFPRGETVRPRPKVEWTPLQIFVLVLVRLPLFG